MRDRSACGGREGGVSGNLWAKGYNAESDMSELIWSNYVTYTLTFGRCIV